MSPPLRPEVLKELGDALQSWAEKHLKQGCWYEVQLEIQNVAPGTAIYLSDVYVQQSTGDGAGDVLCATG